MKNFLKNLLRDRTPQPSAAIGGSVIDGSDTRKRPRIKIKGEYATNRVIAVSENDVRAMYAPAKTFGGPKDENKQIAQDSALEGCGFYPGLSGLIGGALAYAAAPKFPGYAFLSGLTQNALIRAGVETVADEMTREWITLKRVGTADKTQPSDGSPDALEILRGEMDQFGLRDIFHQAAEMCGYFGGCLVYIDTGARGDDLKFPLVIDRATIGRGDVLRFVPVEPINIYPGLYNSINPLAPDYFKPSTWWVLGQEVHESRFLYFVTNPPPMILKPVYNFLGISTAQLAYDYILHFTEDREAASRLLNKFSLTILKTNMDSVLFGDGTDEVMKRVKYMTQLRNNDGTLVVDKEQEDIIQINTPLSGVTDIVRQALELLAAIFRIPAVKLLGISPAGFNATGESDLRNYYDHVHSQQEKIFREPLKKALKLLQINAGLEIDPAITFDFEPLGGEDETAINQRNLISAQTDVALISAGVISAEESRKRLADNPTSGYDDIDPEDVPEQPEGDFTDIIDTEVRE